MDKEKYNFFDINQLGLLLLNKYFVFMSITLILLIIISHKSGLLNNTNIYISILISFIFLISVVNISGTLNDKFLKKKKVIYNTNEINIEDVKKFNDLKKLKYGKNKDYSYNDIINLEQKNEPYKINYVNPYLTNLDNLNLNFRYKYNFGDFKTYLFNKIDELLISKYISFYKILSFNTTWIEEDIVYNDNIKNIFLGLQDNTSKNISKPTNYQIFNKTKALVLMRGHLLSVPALNYNNNNIPNITPIDNNDEEELYIYIFEKNDTNIYKEEDNITIIYNNNNIPNRRTIIDTNLDPNTQYVAHISYLKNEYLRFPKNITLEEYNKQLVTLKNKYNNKPNKIDKINMINKQIYATNIRSDYKDISLDMNDEIIKAIQLENETYNFPNLENNIFYHQDHILYDDDNKVFKKVIHENYPYLLLPVILIDKPNININKPMYYQNTNNIENDKKHRKWLLDEYIKLIESQFKYNIFNIKSFYKQYLLNTSQLKYNEANNSIEHINDPNKSTIYEKIIGYASIDNLDGIYFNKYNEEYRNNQDNFYKKQTFEIKDISFNTYNNLNLSKTIENTYAFNIIIENVQNGIDISNKPVNKDNMPYLKIQFGKIINNKLKILHYMIIDLNITNKKNVIYSKYNKYPFIINYNISDDFNINRVLLNTIDYKNKLEKFKEDNIILNKQDNTTCQQYDSICTNINNNIDMLNNIKTIHKNIYINEAFINTSYLYDYKIKMQLIIEEIIKKFYKENISSITNYSFNFSNLQLITLNSLLKYNNNNRLVLNNKYITNINITSYYRDIYNLKKDFIYFILNQYKQLWYLNTTTNEQEALNNSTYSIETTSDTNDGTITRIFYYFDSIKIFKSTNYFSLNKLSNIINRTPYIIHNKKIGYIKYCVKHICLLNNLLSFNKDDNIIFKLQKNNYNNNSNIYNTIHKIKYLPTYLYPYNISNNDYIFFYNNLYIKDYKINNTYNKSSVSFIDFNDDVKHKDDIIDSNKNGLIFKINKTISNIDIINNKDIIKDSQFYNSNYKYPYELYNRNFLYVSDDFFKDYNIYKYPLFIKIGDNINSNNIDNLDYPDVNCTSTKKYTDNINNSTNIFPIINVLSFNKYNNNIIYPDIIDNNIQQFNSKNIIMIELPPDVITINNSINDLPNQDKMDKYKIFDYTENFTKYNIMENSKITEFIFDKSTPTQFKVKLQFSSINDKSICLNNIINSNIYEQFITFHKNSIKNNDYFYTSDQNKIEYLLPKTINYNFDLLLKQNKLYKINTDNFCNNYKQLDNTNYHIFTIETFYPVFSNSFNKWVNNKYTISNIKLLSLDNDIHICKYTNNDKYKKFINIDNINNTININNQIIPDIDKIDVKDIMDFYMFSNNPNINYIWDNLEFYKKELTTKPKYNFSNLIKKSRKLSNSERKILNGEITKYIYNIIFNDISKIHYNIPKNIGIIKNTNNTIEQFLYANLSYIPYYKRKNIISSITIYNEFNTCIDNTSTTKKNIIDFNKKTLYNISIFDYEHYFYYYKNIFINILGLYDNIYTECNNFIKLGKSILYKKHSNLSTNLKSTSKYIKIPINLNKYLTFGSDFMLFIRNNEKIVADNSTINKSDLGQPVFINNKYFDSRLLNITASNNENTKKIKNYLSDFIKKYNIGISGYNSNIASDICKRIYTVYNKKCGLPIKKHFEDIYEDKKGILVDDISNSLSNYIIYDKNDKNDKNNNDYTNIQNYLDNKERDKCFNTIFDDRTYLEQKQMKDKKNDIFISNHEYNKNKDYYKKYNTNIAKFRDSIEIYPHRISNISDIEEYMDKNMHIEGFAFIQDDSMNINNTNLIEPKVHKTKNGQSINKIQFINENNIKDYPNKGILCFGRKFDNSKLSKENLADIFNYDQKVIKQNIKDIKKYENIEYFNVPEENYSAWN